MPSPHTPTAPGWLDTARSVARTAWATATSARAARAVNTKAAPLSPYVSVEIMRQPQWAPRNYAAFAREGFMQNAIVYRCVRMIAENVAAVPLLVYDGPIDQDAHPLLDLVKRPNSHATRADFLEELIGYLLVSGNAFVEAVSTDDETIRALYNLRPDRMTVQPDADGWPAAYHYTLDNRTTHLAGEPVPGVRRVLHLKQFHPLNDHYGMSPIEAAAQAIDLHNTASKWNKALLDNSARPSGALVYTARDGNLTTDQFERLKRELESGFQGAGNAGRPLLLEGGLDWKAMSLSPKDLDFVEAKHAAAREIALSLGVPPQLLGIPGDSTYANYAEANRAFWRSTIIPLVNRIATAFTHWLAEPLSPTLAIKPDFDQVDALTPERDALWSRLNGASFLTTNEKRAAAGYDPHADGHTLKRANIPLKFSPDQPRDDHGRWTDGGSGGDDTTFDDAFDGTRDPNIFDASGYPIDLHDEEANGGHTLERHVAKSEEYLKARLVGSRVNIPRIASAGEKRAGSFTSLEAAMKLINSTIAANADRIELFRSGSFPFWLTSIYVFNDVQTPTGYEAYAPDGNTQPWIRPTYGVTVRLIRDLRTARGYRVNSAYPMNND